MDSLPITDFFRFSHIFVVAIGMGAAFLADYHTVVRLGQRVDDDLLTTLHSCHSLVWKALIAMWLTGLIMVYIRTGFVLENFSPKLCSKIFTVAILTFNAVLIGRLAMPLVEENRGKSLMWLPLRQKLGLATLAAVSTSSWMLAMAMGVSKVLAASHWLVFIAVLPLVYIGSTLLALVVMYLLHVGGMMGAYRPASLNNLPAVSERSRAR